MFFNLELIQLSKTCSELTMCFYIVKKKFKSKSTLCNCVNVKESLAPKRRDI